MSEKKKLPWFKYLIAAAVIAAVYFINVEVQTRLGKNVLSKMTIERYSLEQALAKAQAENKLVLANLSAIWCPTCRSLDKNVFSNPTVQSVMSEKYVFARIEYESAAGEAFQERYGTRGFPNLLVIAPDGRAVRDLKITSDYAEFISQL